MTRPTFMEAVTEKYSTKWHNVKDKYLYLFRSDVIPNVERWYNTIAPSKHRDSFRLVMKGIHQVDESRTPSPSTANEMELCKANSVIRNYAGPILSNQGKEKVLRWILFVVKGSGAELDALRDVLTGVQSTFTVQSQTKAAFVYRELPDIAQKQANRQKIDWASSKAVEMVRANTAPDATPRAAGGQPSQGAAHRIPVKKSAGFAPPPESDETIDKLKQKRLQHMQTDKYRVDPDTGCSTFVATSSSPRRETNSKSRVMATFQADNTHDWISTTREHIRNYGTKAAEQYERVKPENHPAITLTTASVGLCVPDSRLSPKRKR